MGLTQGIGKQVQMQALQLFSDCLEQFLSDWQQAPYRWDKEIDVQAELFSRLSAVCKRLGMETVKGNYADALPQFRGKQIWNRVCCEPTLKYRWDDDEIYNSYPDLVIWDDADDPDNPPDAKGSANWPVLWLCEIKLGQDDKEKWDERKLQAIVDHGRVAKACWLQLYRELGVGTKRRKSGDVETIEVRIPPHPS
jgi:hypothetical protein